MKTSSDVYIGVGTNLGDRLANLRQARNFVLELPNTLSLTCSSLYLTSPVGGSNQPNYINAVAKIDYAGEALELLAELQSIEQQLGRVRDPNDQNAARLIDLDILLFDQQVFDSVELTIPHPRMLDRLFVLLPLLEIEPKLVLPNQQSLESVFQKAIAADSFKQQTIQKFG